MRAVSYILIMMLIPLFARSQPMTTDPSGGGSRPVPDPTVLTTAAQEKALNALRDLIETRFSAVEMEIKTLAQNMAFQDARAVKRLDDVPLLIDDKNRHLQELMEEKFKGVAQQFEGNATALAAALLAQKTSVGDAQTAAALGASKQEASFIKQIDGIQASIAAQAKANGDGQDGIKALLAAQTKNTDDKIADLRGSIADLRTVVTALTSRGAGQNDFWGYMGVGIGLLIAFFGVLLPRMGSSTHAAPYYPYQPQPQPQVSVVPVVPVPVPPR